MNRYLAIKNRRASEAKRIGIIIGMGPAKRRQTVMTMKLLA
jgi:hypothetical protein